MVERELDPLLEDVRDGDERGMRRVRAGGDRPDVAEDGEVPDRDDVHPRVASRVAVGPNWVSSSGRRRRSPRRARPPPRPASRRGA